MKQKEYVVLRVLPPSGLQSAISNYFPRPRSFPPETKVNDILIDSTELSKKEFYDLTKDPQVQSIAPNIPMKLHEPVSGQEPLTTIDAGTAWGVTAVGADRSQFSGHGITAAILDTGIDGGHVAFNGIELIEKDFTGETNGDSNGHGTHLAGTVFGRAVEGKRIGIASGIKKALIGKVLSHKGGGTTSMITKAIQWALFNDANVILISLGIDFPGYVAQLTDTGYPIDLATSIALEGYRANINLFNTLGTLTRNVEAFLQPAIVLAASGNESKRSIDPNYEIAAAPPSASQGILAVGGLEQKNNCLQVAAFSNTRPDICAPGVDIISANNGGGLRKLSGTSMAVPHAAGVAILWAEKLNDAKNFTIDTLISKLIAGATLTPFEDNYDSADVGAGIIQAPFE